MGQIALIARPIHAPTATPGSAIAQQSDQYKGDNQTDQQMHP
ncbi:hypothetical protein [Cognatishimia sp.]